MADDISKLPIKQQRALFLVEDALKNSRNKKLDYERKAIDWTKQYNAYIESRDDRAKKRKRARMASTRPFAIVESAVSKGKKTLVPANANDPIVRVVAQDDDAIEQTDIVEKWLNWRFRLSKVGKKFELALRHYFLYGFVPIYPKWKIETVKRKIKKPIDAIVPDRETGEQRVVRMGLGDPEEVLQTLFDGPDFEVGSLWDFFPDPSVSDFDDMEWYVREYYKPYDAVKRMVESNKDIYNQSAFKRVDKNEFTGTFDSTSRRYEVLNYWSYDRDRMVNNASGLVKVWDFRGKDRWITVINDMHVIMDTDNLHWDGELPIVVPVRLPQPNQPWGKGMIEPIEKPIAHQVALRNVRLDTLNFSVRPFWITRKGNVLDKTQLEFTDPTTVIEAMDPSADALRQGQISDFSGNVYEEESRILQEIDIATGMILTATDIPANVRSAEQQFSLLENIQEKVQMDIDGFAEGISKLARKFHMLGQMFMSENEIIAVEDEFNSKFPVMRPVDLLGNFDFRITSSAKLIPKSVEARQRLEFTNLLAPILQNPTGFPHAAIKLYMAIAEDLGYQKEYKALHDILEQLRGAQLVNEFAIVENAYANGGVGQSPALQGGRGASGRNTAPENSQQTESAVLRSIAGAS